ncbi:hypothetical protein BJ138DRAFT_1111265 [Hygrophoropsis aurantiaca]|uniref:Uncharacterized protein n=1 Tax=Hygrophoropsis aurantiaca TaxID=72124 RepID=A0ACB8AJA3_9AGAM|nr:hypothetical protein BJ138DRAFT_1111265 [Hygrophoropsis aurantiaca]
MSLPRLPFVIVSTYCVSSAFARPNPPVNTSDRVKGPLYERILPALPAVIGTTPWIPCIAESIIALATNFPPPFISELFDTLLPTGQLPSFNPDRYVFAGAALAALGSFVRIWAIRTLGRHFTLELSVMKQHKLITGGPYAFVRHPSYIGAAIAGTGLAILHASPGSFLRVSGWLKLWTGRGLAAVWAVAFFAGIGMVFARTVREDTYLKAHFGNEWDQYARRVRYRLLPGIF